MQNVAEAAGMQKASLYHHVGKKEDLLFAIHEQMIGELTDEIVPVVSSSRSPSEKIRKIIEIAMQFIARHREGATVFFQERRTVSGERWDAVVAKRDLFEQMVKGVIAEGIRTGAFIETRSDIASRGMMGMVNWCYTWFDVEGELTASEIADIFADIVLQGLEGPLARKDRHVRDVMTTQE